jgi:hypothetical protein
VAGGSVVMRVVQLQHDDDAHWREVPAFTSTATARAFAEWFDSTSSERWPEFTGSVPLGRIYDIVDQARLRSQQWARFAAELEDRAVRQGRTAQQ